MGSRITKAVQSLVLLLLLVAPAAAEVAPTPPPFDPEKAAQAAQVQDPAAATRAYLDAVPGERRAKTKAYARGNYVLDVVEFAYSSLVLVALLGFGLSARMRDQAQRLTRFRPLRTGAYWIQFLVLTTLVAFPLTLYRSYFREKAYGLLSQGFSDWLLDQAKALGIGCVLGGLFLMLLYGVLRRTPRTWWLWGSAVVAAFMIFAIAIAPVYIAPIFNKFTPVHDQQVRESVLAMAHAQGIPADDVFEMDASRRTDRISAYVSGLLGTTRIVMFDTTLRRCTPAEIQMIMGHEMGHYVLNHVWKGVAYFTVVIVAGFLVVRWGFDRAARRWPRMSVTGVGDVAGFPLLNLLLALFLFATAPVTNTVIRVHETEADEFGLNASHEADAAATTLLKLGEYRELEPHPLVEWLFFDHPSGRSRIRHAMEWKQAHLR